MFELSRLPPVEMSRAEVELELVESLKGVLGSGVTRAALRHPGAMEFGDIQANLHLYERLGAAMAALGALRGYKDLPRGYVIPLDESVGEALAPQDKNAQDARR